MVIRIANWYDFYTELFTQMKVEPPQELSVCALAAFSKAMEPHLSWLFARVARLGLRSLPARERFYEML